MPEGVGEVRVGGDVEGFFLGEAGLLRALAHAGEGRVDVCVEVLQGDGLGRPGGCVGCG